MTEVVLTGSDRTIFSTCPKCNKRGRGEKIGDIFCMAYTKKQWARQPKCENCGTDMQFSHEVKVND